MKKIILLLLLFCIKVNAIENIEINNENITPKFNKEYKKYNYFTDKNAIRVDIKSEENELVSGEGVYYLEDGENKIIVSSSNNEEYEIYVYKNYLKNDNNESFLTNLYIEGYDINFNKDNHSYTIVLNDETNLNIDYELSNENTYVSITGNGNFNKSENIIKINVNEEEYIIHALKTANVSKVESITNEKEMSSIKKEIVVFIIITISCILVFLFYYVLFINKTIIHI